MLRTRECTTEITTKNGQVKMLTSSYKGSLSPVSFYCMMRFVGNWWKLHSVHTYTHEYKRTVFFLRAVFNNQWLRTNCPMHQPPRHNLLHYLLWGYLRNEIQKKYMITLKPQRAQECNQQQDEAFELFLWKIFVLLQVGVLIKNIYISMK